MKKIEHHDSSEEEELVFKAKEADQESDPEDFPPGAPEVNTIRAQKRLKVLPVQVSNIGAEYIRYRT